MRYVVDATWERIGADGRIVLGGSPYRLFRLTDAGANVAAAIESGADVARSSLVDRLVDAGAIHPSLTRTSSDRTPPFSVDDVTVVTPQLGGSLLDDRRITVDDGSEPPIEGATVRLDVNRGPAVARNAGRRLVDTLLVAFVDADVDTTDTTGRDSTWLEPLLGHFADPDVGLVAPRVVGDRGSALDLGSEPARIRRGTRVAYVPAAAIVVRLAAFDDVGGFDETLRFGEDVDLVWRLDAAGWRCRYEPAATVRHAPRPTLAAALRQHVGYGSSAAPLALRHPDALAPYRSNGWTFGVWALVAAGHPVVGAGLAVTSAAALTRRLPDVPPATAFRLAMSGHLGAARQIAAAARRAWWPIVALASLASRRARWLGAGALLASPRTAMTDLAYGWGLWQGMLDRRTLRPIVPEISAWPPARSGRSSRRPPRR